MVIDAKQLDETVIERVTFIATRAGCYRSPAAGAFRTALCSALPAADQAAALPLEVFDPGQAVHPARGRLAG